MCLCLCCVDVFQRLRDEVNNTPRSHKNEKKAKKGYNMEALAKVAIASMQAARKAQLAVHVEVPADAQVAVPDNNVFDAECDSDGEPFNAAVVDDDDARDEEEVGQDAAIALDEEEAITEVARLYPDLLKGV